MIVDIGEMTPNIPISKNECYDCIGCPHLVSATVDSSHGVYIECDLDEED